jgi:transposase
MDAPPELIRASREALIALIVAQREELAMVRHENARLATEITTLGEVVTQLTARLGEVLAALAPDGDERSAQPTTMPGLKPTGTGKLPAHPSAPRKRRAHGAGRKRMRPTARQVHAYPVCPACRTPLRGGTRRRRREVIELIPARVEVTEHIYVERRCPHCHGRWQPGPELEGVVVGQGRLGVGVLSLIAVLREELRLPIRGIQWYLAAVAGLRLSVGSIVAAVHTLAARAAPVVAGLTETIRAGPVLHVDETGWREAGANGYAWTFSTPTERVFVHGGRDRGVLTALVGEAYPGVLVSDFYAVYTGYGGRHQYCWAHLLRDVDALVAQHRQDAVVRGWADRVHALYQQALAASAVPDRTPAARTAARQTCETALAALCAPYRGDPQAPQRVLAERMDKHLGELFVFVEEPRVPSTNNAAERSLRHLVTCRKISGGTRSAVGTATKMTLATLFGTWRAQGLNPLTESRDLLAAPQA